MMKRLPRCLLWPVLLFPACDGDTAAPLSPEVEAFLTDHRDPSTWEVLDEQRIEGLPRKVRDPRTGIVFVLVPPGEFEMGGTIPAEQPVHQVRLTRPFYMGETEVTAGQWRKWVEEHGGAGEVVNSPEDHPVTLVSWQDAMGFCARYGYELPTEAQWEYACRGNPGQGEEYWSDAETLNEHAWTGANAGGTAHPVGTRKPNGLGLHDMIGNVWEWCADWHAEGYQADPEVTVDPEGPAGGGLRVLRGGSWFSLPPPRPSDRGADEPGQRNDFYGLRVICRVDR